MDIEWSSEADLRTAIQLESLWMQEDSLWLSQDARDIEMALESGWIDMIDGDDSEFLNDSLQEWEHMEGGAGEDIQEEAAYEIINVRHRHIRKFNVEGRDFRLRIKSFEREKSYPEILQLLYTTFDALLEEMLFQVAPRDKVRLSIQAPALTHEIWIPFVSPNQLTSDRILLEIERVVQSDDAWLFQGDFFVQFVHAPLPEGQVYSVKMANLEKELKTRNCFIPIKNRDNLCAARAIITAKARIENHPNYDSIRRGCNIQEILARNFQRQAGIDLDLPACGPEEWKKFQSVLPNYQLVIVSRDHFNSIIYHGPTKQQQITLYLAERHFSVITSMTAFLRRSYYCIHCRKGYSQRSRHRCAVGCSACCSKTSCVEENKQQCNICHRWFYSESCFENHLRLNTCERLYLCHCQVLVNRDRNVDHKCGYAVCGVCKKTLPIDHKCYMQPIKKKQQSDKQFTKIQRFIIFDFEAMMTENGQHVPNLCVAHIICHNCFTLPMNQVCDICDREQKIFRGVDVVNQLCEWLFDGTHSKTICLSHNGGSYDLYHIMPYIHKQGIKPEVIQNGLKVLCMKAQDLTFIDSLNFLPMSLDKLPSAFRLNELCKGFFPHLFSTPEHQDYCGELPGIEFYDPGGMHVEKRKKFEEWYEDRRVKGEVFDYQEELLRYCISDVDILQRACGAFRELFISVTNTDPFQEAITIASACNVVYRKNFLKPRQIAVIPPNGYSSADNQSAIALTWLYSVSQEINRQIRHVANGGEVRIEGKKIDGIDLETQTLYEFHGCFYHGCPSCYPNRNSINPINQQTMKSLYENTLQKTAYLRNKGFRVIEEWECNFRQKKLKDLQNIYEDYKKWENLNPRDSFYGGRTNAITLFKKPNPGETIRYVDFTSLYPWVCKYGLFPVGHPIVYYKDDPNMPTSVELIQGLVKCTVLPPTKLFHPVLPYRYNQKLTFPLCRSCVEGQQQSICHHESVKERALTGTWVSLELKKALALGYTMIEIHSVWHFPVVTQYDKVTKQGGLFAEYIDSFLKLKQEASDWPTWCHTESDRQHYLRDYEDNEGIVLEPDNIQCNPGMRQLSKLMLNSFWGKFGQQINKDKWTYVDDPAEYVDMMTDNTKEIKDLTYINDECIGVKWKNKGEFAEVSSNTNVIIACYTTAQARLHLYTLLEQLEDRVLYFDTDSVIYVHRDGYYNPPLGDYLGELKDELNGATITTFVSGGPKNYAYQTSTGDKICKIRGFTLNTRNSLVLNYEVVKEIVTTPTEEKKEKIPIAEPFKIVRKAGNLYTIPQTKDYRLVYDKRVIGKNYITYPYGWKGDR